MPIQGRKGCHRGINKMPKECKAATNSVCLREFAKLGRWGGIWTRSYDTKRSRCECPRWRRKADRVMYMETKRYLKTLPKQKEKLGGGEGEHRVYLLEGLCVMGPGGPWARGHGHSLLSPLLTPVLCRPQSDFPTSTMPCTNGLPNMLEDLHSSCPKIHLPKVGHATQNWERWTSLDVWAESTWCVWGPSDLGWSWI